MVLTAQDGATGSLWFGEIRQQKAFFFSFFLNCFLCATGSEAPSPSGSYGQPRTRQVHRSAEMDFTETSKIGLQTRGLNDAE